MPPTPFESLESTLEQEGIDAAFDKLAEILRAEKKYPQLFEALLMKKRHAMGLPVQGSDSIRDLPEPLQVEIEGYYIEICRQVGALFLENGDIAGAWPYFRAIDEPGKVAAAVDGWKPPDLGADPDAYEKASSALDAIVDIALHQGANPRRGYELVLSQHGVCRAITVFEHQFPVGGEVREQCGAMLVRRLHHDLRESIIHDIQRREGAAPEAGDVRQLIEGRPWLFEDHGYHVDVSHLQSVVRIGAGLSQKEALELTLQLAEYGRRLPRDFHNPDSPPFEDFYNDYRIFLQALTGTGADGAMRYFTQKADRFTVREDGKHFPGEVLVHLLDRLGKYQEAIAAHVKYLRTAAGPLTAAPPLIELCERAGDFSQLLEVARDKGDLLHYTAGLIKRAGPRTAD